MPDVLVDAEGGDLFEPGLVVGKSLKHWPPWDGRPRHHELTGKAAHGRILPPPPPDRPRRPRAVSSRFGCATAGFCLPDLRRAILTIAFICASVAAHATSVLERRSDPMKKFLAAALTAGVVLAATLASVPASAITVQDPVEVVKAIVPDVLRETSSEDHVLTTSTAGKGGRVEVRVENRTDGSEVVANGAGFVVDYAVGVSGEEDGVSVLSTEFESVHALVQPTPNGVRVLTTIDSPTAPESYRYIFNVAAGSQLVESAVGYHIVSGTDVLGAIYEPWAIDSKGRQLSTTYSWEAGVLTQHVDLGDPKIAFPVVLDPYWGYTFGYNLGKTPVNAWNSLYSCFSCEFPLPGSPSAFPVSNQLIPLYLGIPGIATVNFEVRRGPVSSATNYRAFQLNATANHIDGYGSSIIFEMKYVGGQSKLIVDAYIVNDFWAGNGVYATGAANSWQIFAWNLGS